jgi:phosphatidylserine/phosphatidylglycerophosphate/cardiolipin synthase-like enzyme
MIGGAKHEILVGGFAISESSGLPDLLAEAGKRVKNIILVCSDWKSSAGVDARTLFTNAWPKESTRPQIYECKSGANNSLMHIKCLIVDAHELLIGSANFTGSGMRKNYEIGILIKGETAKSARIVYQELLETGNFEKVENLRGS